jgi:hypothetical protein
VNKSDFLTLSSRDQEIILSQSGNLLITRSQGNTRVDVYQVKEFFVKVTVEKDGYRKVEAGLNYDDFNLFNKTAEAAWPNPV